MSFAGPCYVCGVAALTVVALPAIFNRTTSAVPPASAIVVSHPSPFARCAAGRSLSLSDGDTGYINSGETGYVNTAVEPSVAANPTAVGTSHANLIGVWQQDRWSSGGARGIAAAYSFDGGTTWGESALPFSSCASRLSPFGRASDPWVSIGPDGMAYASAVGLGSVTNAVLVTTSTDGGKSWGRLQSVVLDRNGLYQNDKPSITADPTTPGVAYVTWNRTQQPVASHDLRGWFAETTDGGRIWSKPRQLAPALEGASAFGHQIVVDPKRHILYTVFLETVRSESSTDGSVMKSAGRGRATTSLIAFVKSMDRGRSWSSPRAIARVPPLDPLVDFEYRLGYPAPAAAVDPVSGKVYVVWTAASLSEGDRPEIVLVSSTNGGSSWSSPHGIGAPGTRPTFTPAAAVSRQGDLGVTFYSANELYAANTDSDPTPPSVLVDAWFIGSRDGGRHFAVRVHLKGPFNYLVAPFAKGYFLGDYQGLAVSGPDFHPFFVVTSSVGGRNRTDVFTATVEKH